MPPRKSTRSAAAAVAAPTSELAGSPTDQYGQLGSITTALATISSRVESACADWSAENQAVIKSLIAQQLMDLIAHRQNADVDSDATSLPEMALSRTLSILFQRVDRISLDQLAELYQSIIDGHGGEEKLEAQVALGEALVELVEVLVEERENLDALAKDRQETTAAETSVKDGGMDVEGQVVQPLTPHERGLALIKVLLASEHLPSYLPTLILSNERLLPLGLHPIPHNPDMLRSLAAKRNTALFYKQSKYNLLRESSEGFSRLIVLLLGSDALPPTYITQQESDEDRAERARGVWSKIMGLIGYFSLSPPRVLDLVLEIASCNVAEHWQFWLELLRCSPWGATAKSSKGKERMWDESVQGIERALDGQGDRVLAQVLGVKFSFCQRPDGGDTPIGLVYMAALLLKHGFVTFADLLPFMAPDDASMTKIRDDHIASLSKTSGPQNALTKAVLVDEDTPATSNNAAEQTGPPPKPPPEQRIQLLQALLAIGHMPPALYLLGKAPWLAQYYPAIADLIMRIVERNIEPIYRANQQEWADAIQGDEDLAAAEMELMLDAPASHYRPKQKRIVKTLWSPTPADTPTTRFEFFYPDWAEGQGHWETIHDVREKGLAWLGLIRGLGGRNAEVMIKLCRVGQVHFTRLRKEREDAVLGRRATSRADARAIEPTDDEMRPWLDILRISLLPSLSASNVTAAFDIEIWRLLKLLPYATRYSLYGEWRDSTTNARMGRNPCLIAAAAASEATRAVKQALSRVTAQKVVLTSDKNKNVQQDRGPARTLAKLCHSNPCALWATAVIQVKNYANIGQSIIDAGRYMTQLSYDVATFTILDTLSNDTASRLNANGTGIADWLQHLAVFAGDFNRKYNSMDLEPILQFIMNRLMRGQSGDLAVLDSLITCMTGALQIDNDAISPQQLEAHLAGPELLREAFELTQYIIYKENAAGDTVAPRAVPIDNTKTWKKSLPRLIRSLRETGMAMPILLGLAQTSQGSTDKMAFAPIKAVSLMQDSCHSLFVRFGDLLREHFSSAEILASTPDLQALVQDFGLDFAQAFQILRPSLAAQLSNDKPSAEGANGEVDTENQSSAVKAFWPAALQSPIDQACLLLPANDFRLMTSPFFVTFWQLSLADVGYSAATYDHYIKRVSTMADPIYIRKLYEPVSDAARTEESARLYARKAVLVKEKAVLAKRSEETRKRLEHESKLWFSSDISAKQLRTRLCQQLHQHCFYPRAIQTPGDAIFVPTLIRFMHDIGTPQFTTLFAYSNFVQQGLSANIFACTENEARNLGRCIAAIMRAMDRWHADEEVYKREAIGEKEIKVEPTDKEAESASEDVMMNGEAPGAANGPQTVKTRLPGMLVTTKSSQKQIPMTWSQYRAFYAQKFHTPLCEALVSCWNESEFMHVKNAITVGLQVMPSFPMMLNHDAEVKSSLEALLAKEGDGSMTEDVKLQCKTFLTQLQARQKKVPCVDPPTFFAAGKSVLKPLTRTPSATSKDAPTPVPSDAKPPAELKENGRTGAKAEAPSTTATEIPSSQDAQAADRAAALRAKLATAKAESSRRGANAEVAPAEPTRSTSTADVSSAKAADEKLAPPAGPRGSISASVPSETKEPPSGPAKKEAPTGPSGRSSMGPPASEKPLSVADQRAAEDARRFAALSKSLPAAAPLNSTTTSATAPGVKAEVTTPSRAPTGPKGSNMPAAEAKESKPEIPAEKATTSSRRSSPDRNRDAARRRSRSVESRASERSRRDRRDERPRDRDRERDGEKDRERERDRDKERDRDRSRRDGERARDRRGQDPRGSDREARRENGGSPTPSVRGDDEHRKGEELLPATGDDRRRILRADSRDRANGRDERERDRRTSDRGTDRDRARDDERGARRRRDDDRASRDASRRDDRDRHRDRDEREHEKDGRARREPPRDERDRASSKPRDRSDHVRSDHGRDVRNGDSKRELLPEPAVSSQRRDTPLRASAADRQAEAPRNDRVADIESTRPRESTPLAARIQGASTRIVGDKDKTPPSATPARAHGLPQRPEASTPTTIGARDRPAEGEGERRPANSSLPTKPSENAAPPTAIGGSLAARLGMRDGGREDSRDRRDGDRPRDDRDDARASERGGDGRNGRDDRDRDVRDGRDIRGGRDDRDRDARTDRGGMARSDRDARDVRDRRDDRERERERERDRHRGGVREAGESRRDEEERDRERKRPHDAVADAATVTREGSPAETSKRIRIDRNRARREGNGSDRRLFDSALQSAKNGGS